MRVHLGLGRIGGLLWFECPRTRSRGSLLPVLQRVRAVEVRGPGFKESLVRFRSRFGINRRRRRIVSGTLVSPLGASRGLVRRGPLLIGCAVGRGGPGRAATTNYSLLIGSEIV